MKKRKAVENDFSWRCKVQKGEEFGFILKE